ncbi:MAG: sigma 54-interacting transcriptional regulator [Desulfobacterota bacterium]|nr:sigma 54-interacting transcriptional regulator [Thermodesulfobacteriota bacterium]
MNYSVDKYHTLLKINNAIIHERSRDGLFREITKVLQPLLGFDRISILLNQPGKPSWDYFAPAIGVIIPGLRNNTMPPQKALVPIKVMMERKTLIVDVQKDPLLPEAGMLKKANLKWFVCSPLAVGEKVLGTIQVFYKKAFPLTAEDIDFFEQISKQVALAVDNLLAYEELEQLRDKLREEKAYLKNQIEQMNDPDEIVFLSPAMQHIIDQARSVAETDTTVLITGETGTGKDMVARFIHRHSERRHNTFIKVNCAALVPTLIESELFGHERGAFTGAISRKIGRFEIAHKSTLFLDEIGELPMAAQAKLLQVLQDRVFERVGGTAPIKTDVRIIAATNQNLQTLVSEKKFREDLFYRLNIFPLHVPPLRDRPEDIPVLGKYFADRFCDTLHRDRPVFRKDAIDLLLHYHWPGNVRELENFIERVIILHAGKTVTAADISKLLNVHGEADHVGLRLAEIERRHIEKVLAMTGGLIAGPRGAAALLGLKRGTLQHKMKKLHISAAAFKKTV